MEFKDRKYVKYKIAEKKKKLTTRGESEIYIRNKQMLKAFELGQYLNALTQLDIDIII